MDALWSNDLRSCDSDAELLVILKTAIIAAPNFSVAMDNLFNEISNRVKGKKTRTEEKTHALRIILMVLKDEPEENGIIPNSPSSSVPFICKLLLEPLCEMVRDDSLKELASAVLSAFEARLIEAYLEPVLLPAIFQILTSGKWNSKLAALDFLVRLSKGPHANVIARCLPLIIPPVSSCMVDLKKEVAKAAHSSMTEIAKLASNLDIEAVLPTIVQCMARPQELVETCIEKLSKTTFVAEVTGPVLSILVPPLSRALSIRNFATVRRTVIIINNLCKMVKNAKDAAQFLPQLMPGLSSLVDNAAFPEIRSLATSARETLENAVGTASSGQDTSMNSLSLRDQYGEVSEFISNVCLESGLDPLQLSIPLEFASDVLLHLIKERAFDKVDVWERTLSVLPMKKEQIDFIFKHYQKLDKELHKGLENEAMEEEEDDVNAPVLCDCEFSLAYGGMLLLNHTRLKFRRGRRYGLCGHNGAGKSTLMRAISKGQLEGFPSPTELKTVFVEHALQGEDTSLPVVDFIQSDEKLNSSREEIQAALVKVGFTGHLLEVPVSAFSGGWKMKLELARAMLLNADILLLDEPTNHLDVANVAWLEEYLLSQKRLTCVIVSHDSGFLDTVCTDIINYENKKLVNYHGNLTAFSKKRPELAKAYFALSASNVKFVFPKPSSLSGVRSNTRAILKLNQVSLIYPGTERKALHPFTGSLCLSSRVGVVGKNGAGKSTLIKVMTGEYVPTEGSVWKHPNLRIGYVAQYAFHHLEEHAHDTPFRYLMWRYQGGEDREVLMKETRQFSAQDLAQMQVSVPVQVTKGGNTVTQERKIEYIFGRRKLKKTFQYEIKWSGYEHKHNTWMSRDQLLELGFQKLVQAFDDHESSREGLSYRELTREAITQHFEDVGLDPKIAENNSISSLSGGQKVKVVIAACMWNNPHLLVLDEPTNFLDRDSLGGLAVAIRDWAGAVVIISHNEEFIGSLCPETWSVVDGHVTKNGKSSVDTSHFEDIQATVVDRDEAATPSDQSASPAPSTPKPAKKKKLTRNQLKEQEARRRARKLKWLIEGGELIINSDEED